MKQKLGSKNCAAVCAAMAFGCSVEEFESFFPPREGRFYSDLDFIKFALHKGYYTGVSFSLPEIEPGTKTVSVTRTIYGTPAYIVVESPAVKNEKHAVYWDGSKVHDPHPQSQDGMPLHYYKIIEFYPLLKMNY